MTESKLPNCGSPFMVVCGVIRKDTPETVQAPVASSMASRLPSSSKWNVGWVSSPLIPAATSLAGEEGDLLAVVVHANLAGDDRELRLPALAYPDLEARAVNAGRAGRGADEEEASCSLQRGHFG